MDEWLTKLEIEAKYRHVSQHQLPFETEIIEIIPPKGINFSVNQGDRHLIHKFEV